MTGGAAALNAARLLCELQRCELFPLEAIERQDLTGKVMLGDATPDAAELARLAELLPQLSGVVLWCPEWSVAEAGERLAEHGFDEGTVDAVAGESGGVLCVLVNDAETARSYLERRDAEIGEFKVLGLLPTFNEADIIWHTVAALVSEGVDVYLLDNGSTDGTRELLTPWLGKGLVAIERFPEESGYPDRDRDAMVWSDILRRCGEVATEINADWYIFTNADEFREAPWPHTMLAKGLRDVEELGYNAVNFELFDFRPVDDSFEPGEDPRRYLSFYQPPGSYDTLQVKAWQRQATPVDIVTFGGHDLVFAGKRIFPVPFILRHYPIRSSEHGRRKVMNERLPRFAPEERARNWHVQYDCYANGQGFLQDQRTMCQWNPDSVRAELMARALWKLLLALTLTGIRASDINANKDAVLSWLHRRGHSGLDADSMGSLTAELMQHQSGSDGTSAVPRATQLHDLALALSSVASVRGEVEMAAAIKTIDARIETEQVCVLR